MAFFRAFGSDLAVGESGYDPHRLSSPQVFLYSMLVFLAIAGFIAAILYRQISTAFSTNPGLNGLILGVLVVGILLAFLQVVRLFREIRWVNSFRAGSETVEPVLLAPMKALLSRSASMALSTSSMRSMLDSIATASTSRATSRATSPACSSSSACSAPSGACCRRSARSATRSVRSTPARATPTTCSRR
jgi:hypothetical protein